MKPSEWHIVSMAPTSDYTMSRFVHWWDRWRLRLARWLLPAMDAPRRDMYRVTTRTGTTDARGRPHGWSIR